MNDIIISHFNMFISRLVSVTLSCMFWMVQGDFRLITTQHWIIGIQTGFAAATILLILYSSSLRILFNSTAGKIISTAIIVTIVDRIVHPSHFGGDLGEGIATGITAALLAMAIGLIRNLVKI